MLGFAFAYLFVLGGCATTKKPVMQPVGTPEEINITSTDDMLSITVLRIQKAKKIHDKKKQVNAPQGKLFHLVNTNIKCKMKRWAYGRQSIRMLDEDGKTYALRGNWTHRTLYRFGNKTFVFEIPEDTQISLLRFGPLPPIDIQRRVIVDISQQIIQNAERQKALEWMKANTVGGDLVANFLKELDKTIAMEAWKKWHIGWNLTNSKHPYIVKWADGAFQFEELTIEEAKKKGFKASSDQVLERRGELWMCY